MSAAARAKSRDRVPATTTGTGCGAATARIDGCSALTPMSAVAGQPQRVERAAVEVRPIGDLQRVRDVGDEDEDEARDQQERGRRCRAPGVARNASATPRMSRSTIG